jgi:hypothetical protein
MAQRKQQGNTRIVGLNCIFIFASFSKGNPDIQTQIQKLAIRLVCVRTARRTPTETWACFSPKLIELQRPF